MTLKTTLIQELEASTKIMGIDSDVGIGIDIEELKDWEKRSRDPLFLARNYTLAEIDYCERSPNPLASFAGRWTAKEAVVKAISSFKPYYLKTTLGMSAPLIEIEILSSPSEAPLVALHGHPRKIAEESGIQKISLSISHSDHLAISIALAV